MYVTVSMYPFHMVLKSWVPTVRCSCKFVHVFDTRQGAGTGGPDVCAGPVYFAGQTVTQRCFDLEAMLDSYLPNILDKEARLHKVLLCSLDSVRCPLQEQDARSMLQSSRLLSMRHVAEAS